MRTGEIISRIGDAVKIRVFVNDVSINLILNIFILVVSFILMFTFFWKLALIMLFVVPFYAAIYYISNRLNRKIQRQVMERAADLESQLVESLNSAGTIKRFGLEDFSNLKTETRFVSLLEVIYKSGSEWDFFIKFNKSDFSDNYNCGFMGRGGICTKFADNTGGVAFILFDCRIFYRSCYRYYWIQPHPSGCKDCC